MARSRARICTFSICVLSDLALLVDGEVQCEELYSLCVYILSDLALLIDGQVQGEELYSLYLCTL